MPRGGAEPGSGMPDVTPDDAAAGGGAPLAPTASIKVRRRRSLSVIWLIPIVAIAIAGWVVFDSLGRRGPSIELFFASAEGLEADKTAIRFKDVDVGVVRSVGLTEDLSRIRVVAEMQPLIARFLTDRARFWIVRPRVGVGGISGLGTLVSGSFIEMDVRPGGEARATFEGVEEPPLIRSTEPGREFVLTASSLGGVARGAPVYYRGLEVGQVLGQELAPDASGVIIHIFVASPHDRLVRAATRFWNASGLRFTAGSGGLDLSIAPLQALLVGGIAFDTPADALTQDEAASDTAFSLFATEADSIAKPFASGRPALVYFEGSVRGLNPEAAVELRGIRVGTVRSIRLELDAPEAQIRIPVVMELEPWRWTSEPQPDEDAGRALLARLVKRGLRARLESGNILTGELIVSLDFYPDAPSAELTFEGDLPVLPAVPSQLQELTASVSGVLRQVSALPLQAIAQDARDAIRSVQQLAGGPATQGAITSLERSLGAVERLVSGLDKDVPAIVASLRGAADSASATLRDLRGTVASVNALVNDKSPLRYDLGQALDELSNAARSIREFADYLDRHPDALLRGRQGNR